MKSPAKPSQPTKHPTPCLPARQPTHASQPPQKSALSSRVCPTGPGASFVWGGRVQLGRVRRAERSF
ncbi:hypothetical protein DL95DRAFT_389559, partial [Leptodontidium sp. 2 PMI_412]